MPTPGGLVNGITGGHAIGCDVVQVFTKSPRQWAAKPLSEEDWAPFRARCSELMRGPTVAHDTYLINLAAPDPVLLEKSRRAFLEELERADTLGIAYLVTHCGAAVGDPEEDALKRLAESLDVVLDQAQGLSTRPALETTAGQGTSLCHRFEHLRAVLDTVERAELLTVCLDTCHVFAAGYGLETEAETLATLQEFDDVVGLDRLSVLHLNDSKRERGSRVDRHEHLGQGAIGEAAFRTILAHPQLRELPMIVETPEAETRHCENVARLREWAG